MIVSYKTGAEFLQDNQTYLQKNPYLSTFFTLDAPLLQEASKINYALRCEQGETRLLALKVEPYNLLLFGEEAFVPELLRFLFDGGYEIKNYLYLIAYENYTVEIDQDGMNQFNATEVAEKFDAMVEKLDR